MDSSFIYGAFNVIMKFKKFHDSKKLIKLILCMRANRFTIWYDGKVYILDYLVRILLEALFRCHI